MKLIFFITINQAKEKNVPTHSCHTFYSQANRVGYAQVGGWTVILDQNIIIEALTQKRRNDHGRVEPDP